jgi:hypothetical protein
MDILETQLVQRAHDGYWERIGKIEDVENSYEYRDEAGVRVTLTPIKWITLAVYPFIMEAEGF